MGFIGNLLGTNKTSTAGIDESNRHAYALRQALLGERTQAGYQPERVTPGYETFAGEARYNDPGQAAQFTAATAQDPDAVQVGQLAPVERVASQSVNAPNLGAAATANAQRVDSATINQAGSNEFRGEQMGLAQQLRDAAAGKGPSVAENAYNAKLADVAREAHGVAARARGSDRAYARLAATRQVADQTRRAAFDAAQLRAGEQIAARGQLGSVLSEGRGGDIGLATEQARLQQGASTTNAQLGTGVSEGNRDAFNRRAEIQGQMGLEAATGNAQRDLAAQQGNQGAQNARTMDEAQFRADVAAGNVGRTQQNRQFNTGATNAAAATNTAAINERQSETAGRRLATDQANLAARQDVTGRNVDRTMAAATANQGAGLQGAQLDEQRKQGLASGALDAGGQWLQGEQARAGVKQADAARRTQLAGGIISGAATAGAALSDERSKSDIKDVSPDAAERLANALRVVEFRYKGQDEPKVGVVAQELEKDPLGKKMVSEGPGGMKQVDYGGLAPLLLLAAMKNRKETRG